MTSSDRCAVSITVILPVHNMRRLAVECASAVARQLTSNDSFVVIDDHSNDGAAQAIRDLGVTVISARDRGPYAARHQAASAATADVLLFVDGRSRPFDGWLDAHRALFADEAVSLTCTGTAVKRMPGIAPRVFRASNMFELSTKLDVPGRLGFYPTANLGVRRSAYDAVGGFRRMRSGGDADLCWRIQLHGQGSFAADRRILMEWVPRARFNDVVRQWVRYGKSSAYLEALYRHEWPEMQQQRATTRRSLMSALVQTARQFVRTPFATLMQLTLDVLNVAVYWREKRRFRSASVQSIAPVPFAPAQEAPRRQEG